MFVVMDNFFLIQGIYFETNRLLRLAQEKIRDLNRIHHTSSEFNEISSSTNVQIYGLTKEIDTEIENIKKNFDRLDVLVAKEPALGSRRVNAKFRVDQLKTDLRCLQSSYSSIQARAFQKEQEARNRENLLQTSFTTNAEASKQNGMRDQNLKNDSNCTSILIDHAMAQSQTLNRSNKAVDDMLAQGSAILGNKIYLSYVLFRKSLKSCRCYKNQ